MSSINFIYNWGNGSHQNSWSGTPYNLLNALKKRVSVNDCSITTTKKDELYYRIRNAVAKLKGSNDFGMGKIIAESKKIDSLQIANGPHIVFSEYNTKYTENCYVYQDLTVMYCNRNINSIGHNKFMPLMPDTKKKEIDRRINNALKFYNKCRGIFTMSEFLKNDLVSYDNIPEKKVHYIGAGCNIDINKIDKSKKTGNKFLFVGIDWERKNGPLVLDAFIDLQKIYKDIELYIVGIDAKDGFDDKGSKNNVFFLGRKNREDIVDYYNKCDYFVMPSVFEAFGIVFVEALQFGLPCIAKNAFAMPEIVKSDKNSLLIKKDDKGELMQKMEELLLRGAKYVKNVNDDYEYYKKEYSWDAVADRVITAIRNDGYDI